jgi:hypothetical protein
VAGFQEWKTLGRQVTKGQAGYMIYAPVTARLATTHPADAESWRPLDRGEKAQPGEVLRSKMIGNPGCCLARPDTRSTTLDPAEPVRRNFRDFVKTTPRIDKFGLPVGRRPLSPTGDFCLFYRTDPHAAVSLC